MRLSSRGSFFEASRTAASFFSRVSSACCSSSSSRVRTCRTKDVVSSKSDRNSEKHCALPSASGQRPYLEKAVPLVPGPEDSTRAGLSARIGCRRCCSLTPAGSRCWSYTSLSEAGWGQRRAIQAGRSTQRSWAHLLVVGLGDSRCSPADKGRRACDGTATELDSVAEDMRSVSEGVFVTGVSGVAVDLLVAGGALGVVGVLALAA